MTVTRAMEDQFESVRRFYHSLIDAMAEGPSYVKWQKDIYPAPEFLEDSIRNGELYIVTVSDEIAAAMVFNHDYNESYKQCQWQTDADDSEVMVIHALGVHPYYSGKGYAKAMVEKAISIARDSGMKAIRLDVLEGNIPAEKLYLGFGFKYMTTLQRYYENTGWTNFKLYELLL